MLTGPRNIGVEPTPGHVFAVQASAGTIKRALAAPPDALGGLDRWIGHRPVHVVTWDADQVHRLVPLPRMTAVERLQFLEREVGPEGAGGPKAVAAQVLGRAGDGSRKDEVLVVATPREALDRHLAPFLARRRPPRLVSTVTLAIVAAAAALRGRALERPTIVAHAGLGGLTVAVVAEGKLRSSRQIPPLAVPGLDPAEWLVAEIDRSARHYAQTAKGERVEEVLVSTAEATSEAALTSGGTLETRLGLLVVNLNDAMRELLPADVEAEWGLAAGAFLPAFGGALLRPRRMANLLPRAISFAVRSRVAIRAAVAIGVLAAGGLGLAFQATSREAAGLRASVARERAGSEAIAREVIERQRIEAERQRVRRSIRLLRDDPVGGARVGDALKEVSRLAPDRLRLERLAVAKDGQGYSMKLVGTVRVADLVQAQAAFNELYFGLSRSPLFHNVVVLKSGAPSAGAGSAGPPAPRPQGLAFELTLRLKALP